MDESGECVEENVENWGIVLRGVALVTILILFF